MKWKDEWAFYRKPSGKISYHRLCKRCIHRCKQSWCVKALICPKYHRADCPKGST